MTDAELIEPWITRLAEAWASIDGKADLFRNDDGSDRTLGYRDGYLNEAAELLIRSGLADRLTQLSEENARAQEDIANLTASLTAEVTESERLRAALAQGQKEGK